MTDIDELKKIALQIRAILEGNCKASPDYSLQSFPNGCCGAASELLARYLREMLQVDAQYVGAHRKSDGWTHAWVQVHEIIVDITADQFQQPPVIVTANSDWHAGWHIEDIRKPIIAVDQWPAYPEATWQLITKEIDLPL